MPDQTIYQPGQVTWALWQWLSQHGSLDPRRQQVPRSFVTRIRNMIELGVPFSESEKPGKSGISSEYTVHHVFELAVALMLQDGGGLKQAEAAFFVRNMREQLRAVYDRIMESPPVPGNVLSAKDRPNSPTMIYVDGEDQKGLGAPFRKLTAFPHVYMTFRCIEVPEAWSFYDRRVQDERESQPIPPRPSKPIFLDARFHDIKGLVQEMEYIAASGKDPIRIVVELGTVAVLITDYLHEAPPVRRGPR